MNRKNNAILIGKFIEVKQIKKEIYTALIFAITFLIIGVFENNLFLPDNGLGLLEHMNIWFFLAANIAIPIVIHRLIKSLEINVTSNTFNNLKISFTNISKHRGTIILGQFCSIVGFCFFIGNSLQNANVINQLTFDYWDSVSYIASYIASRIYKFYLFAYFIPTILVYVFVLIKSLSELMIIKDNEMAEYPIKNYEQLNVLCNLGLNILLIISITFIILSGGVYFVHGRLDITSSSTIIVSIFCSLILLVMYIFLIKKYYISIRKYKIRNLERINSELSKIHDYILGKEFDEHDNNKLEVYLKKETYLCELGENIKKINNFPLIYKAIFTCITPTFPALLDFCFQLLKASINLEKLTSIL